MTRTLALLAVVGLAVAGCGGHHGAAESASRSPSASPSGNAVSTPPPPRMPAPRPSSAPPAAAHVPSGPVPLGFQALSASWISSRTGWVLGWAPCPRPTCAALLRTHDGGRTWAGGPAPVVDVRARANGQDRVRFADASNGWVFGGTLLATHDGGAHWHSVALPGMTGTVHIDDLEAAAGVVYVVATSQIGDATPVGYLFRASAGSDAFGRVAGVPALRAWSASISLYGTHGWLLAGPDTNSFYATSDGRDWARRPGPCGANPGLAGLAPVDSTRLFAACDGGAAAGSMNKPIYVSADGGRSFRPVVPAPFGGDFEQLAAASAQTVAVAAYSGLSMIYVSPDGGLSWRTGLQFNDGGVGFSDLGFTTATQGFVIEGTPWQAQFSGSGPSRMYLTRDGGRSWQRVSF